LRERRDVSALRSPSGLRLAAEDGGRCSAGRGPSGQIGRFGWRPSIAQAKIGRRRLPATSKWVDRSCWPL